MGRIYDMAIALSGKIDKSLSASVLSAAGALSGLENKLSTLRAAQQKTAKYSGLKNSMAAMNVEYQASRAEVQKLGEWMSHIKTPSKEMQIQFNKAQSKSEKLREKLLGQRHELDKLGRGLKAAGVDTKNLAKFEEELAAKAAKASTAQAALQKSQAALTAARDRLKLSNIQGELMESGAIFLALKKPIQAAAAFETTMAEIKKVVDFESPDAFKAMGTDLQELSLRIPMTTEALGKIYAAGGQSGIAQKDLLAFTETAAKMGVAFDVSADQAGEWMAKWRTAFKMEQTQVTQLADQINYLGNNTAASAAQISDVVSRIGPLGAVGNLAAKQIAALGASMIGAGQSEEVAATGAKNFMLALTAGEAATKKQKEAFAKLNIDPKILAQEMMRDPEQVMTGILERISKVDKSQQSALLTQMFGRESVAAIAPLLSNLDNLRRNLSLVSGEGFAGSMEKEFAALADTATNSFRLAQNAAAVFSQNIGDALLPTVKSAATSLVGISSAVLKFSQAHPEAFSTFVKAVAAFGALKVAKNVTSILWTMVKLPFLEAKTAVLALKGAYIAADGSLLTMIKNTKIFKAAQWALNVAIGAGRKLLSVAKLVAYKTVQLAIAVASKVWAAAQWILNAAMTVGGKLLSVGKLVVYKTAQLAIAVASKAWAAAQWILNAALTANPIGLVVAAIAGLVAAFVLAYKKCDWFREKVDSAMAKIKAIFLSGFEKISLVINKVGETWEKFKSALGIAPKIPVPESTAAQIAGNIPSSIAAHAVGGIFNKPHLGLVAEAGRTESIIPHDSGGERIWQTTGEMAGFSMQDAGGGTVFSPTINLTVNAQPGADGNEIGRQALKTLEHELPRLLRRCEEQRLRVAY
ncbi:MAG: phage tail tape measure protein [Synergistaceae bacterium]|nr:phage tail tape measure protein [Synergistaceae bacterium]